MRPYASAPEGAVGKIDFDLDLREMQGQERLGEFCEFFGAVGSHLGKPVLMAHEMGDPAEHREVRRAWRSPRAACR